MGFALDYDKLIPLDAEALAEGGIKAAYEKLVPALREYVSAAPIQERMDHDRPSYSVVALGKEYPIYDRGDDEYQSWGVATFALFDIVNRQLERTEYRFFAINGGNELGGMFLTPAEAQESRKSLPRKQDWPYLPKLERPWYGQHH